MSKNERFARLEYNEMAKFYISAIRLDSKNQHIEFVKTHAVNSDGSFNAGASSLRQDVAGLINAGKASFQTIYEDPYGTWNLGATVKFLSPDFLTTAPDHTTKNNLDNLPKF